MLRHDTGFGSEFEGGLLIIEHPQPSAADLRNLSPEQITYGVSIRPEVRLPVRVGDYELGVLVDPRDFSYNTSTPWRPWHHGLRRDRWSR